MAHDYSISSIGARPGDVPSGETLAEVDKLSRSFKVVSVLALLGGRSTTFLLHVADQSGMRFLLVAHKVDEVDIILGDTGLGKLLGGESGGTVVEQIELDPFLVQGDIERFKVD